MNPLTWQQELRDLLDRVPGAAERIALAVDDGRIHGCAFGFYQETSDCGCAYGHAYQSGPAAWDAADQAFAHGFQSPIGGGTMLEVAIHQNRYAEVRAECVQWLAEHGTAVESVPAPAMVAQ